MSESATQHSTHAHSEGDETRLRLLDAAVVLFAEAGFDGVSVRQICDRADVKNIGAINYHFQGKDGLYKAAVHHALSRTTKRVTFPEWSSETLPTAKLRGFITGMVTQMINNPDPQGMGLVMREFSKPTPTMEEVVRAHIKPMADQLHRILGELLPKMPYEQRVRVGFSIIGQCLYYHQNRPVAEVLFGKDLREMTAEIIANHISDFSLAALGFAPPLTAKPGGKR
jgi:AcrR family transcriptional regulator